MIVILATSCNVVSNLLGSGTGPTSQTPATNVGAKLLSGNGSPTTISGANGDLYLDTSAAVLYVKNNSIWVNVATLQGPAGTNGNIWLSGSGVPSSLTGNVGDFYLDTATTNIYKKAVGAWNLMVNLQGPAGSAGATGAAGASGATWLTGGAAPTATQGNNGDLYLNTSTATIYQKAGGAWNSLLTLQGPAGPAGQNGSTWFSGAGIPSNTVGATGDFYLDTNATNVYKKGATTWSLVVGLQGATGATGATGPAGATGATGATGPAGATGATGPAGAPGATGPAGTPGATGATGPAGTPGAVWITGTGAPASTQGNNGDLYLDTAAAVVYQKASGAWTNVMAIATAVQAVIPKTIIDNFDNSSISASWTTIPSSSATLITEGNGRLRINSPSTETYLSKMLLDPVLIPTNDYTISIDTYWISGTPSSSQYGIVVRDNGSNQNYKFKISANGYYSIYMGSTALVAWTSTTMLNLNGWNNISVRCIGAVFKFYINGSLRQELTDSTYTSGSVGFYSSPDSIVEFDNFEADPINSVYLTKNLTPSDVIEL